MISIKRMKLTGAAMLVSRGLIVLHGPGSLSLSFCDKGGGATVWHEDLSAFADLGPKCGTCLRAVGWLERGRPFATGTVDAAAYSRLIELFQNPWEPAVTMGFHRCDLCLYDGPPGKRNIYIPTNGEVFVAPELVTHYMNAHGYRPPDVFCAAVLACPEMRSMQYLKALLAVARPLVQVAG
jgi:hypothetical protein